MIEGGGVTQIAFGVIILMFLVVGGGLLLFFGQDVLARIPFLSILEEEQSGEGKVASVVVEAPDISAKELLGFVDYPAIKLPQPLPNPFSAAGGEL